MNAFDELKRVGNYNRKNQHFLKQEFIESVDYNEHITVTIHFTERWPSQYLPTIVNGRYVKVLRSHYTHLSKWEKYVYNTHIWWDQ